MSIGNVLSQLGPTNGVEIAQNSTVMPVRSSRNDKSEAGILDSEKGEDGRFRLLAGISG